MKIFSEKIVEGFRICHVRTEDGFTAIKKIKIEPKVEPIIIKEEIKEIKEEPKKVIKEVIKKVKTITTKKTK